EKIYAIAEDDSGILWIGSFAEGLTSFVNGKFTPKHEIDGYPVKKVTAIFRDGNGELWVTTPDRVFKLTKNSEFQSYATPEDLKTIDPNSKFNVSFYDSKTGELWLGTFGSGLLRKKNGNIKPFGIEQGLPNMRVIYLYKDKSGNLWIGTDGGGLTRLKDRKLDTLSGTPGITDSYIYSMAEDREKNLWVGTLDHGLFQLRDNTFTAYTTREGLIHDHVKCICPTSSGELLIGTNKGISRFKNGEFKPLLPPGNRLENTAIVCISQSSSGLIRIGTDKGLYRFKEGKSPRLTPINELSDNKIICLLEDRIRGCTWVGTGNGLNRIDNNTDKITVCNTAKGLSGNVSEFLFMNDAGTVFVGTGEKLNRMDKPGTFTVQLLPDSSKKEYSFKCAIEDGSGTLWFGTNQGLIRIRGDQTNLYTIKHGLIENDINSILEDDAGYLWLGGENGISRIKKSELEAISHDGTAKVKPKWFTERDGMKSGWCNGPATKAGGRLFFPTAIGITTIDPDDIKTFGDYPWPHIETLIVNDREVPIPTDTSEANPIPLEHEQDWLEISYTGLTMINSDLVTFKYKLEGYDDNWSDAGNSRKIIYNVSSPGTYTFRIKAIRSDGKTDNQEDTLSLRLQPHFSETILFYISITLFILILAFSIYRLRVRQLKIRGKVLSGLVDQRTKDLKERNIELETAQQNLRQSNDLIAAKNTQLQSQTSQLTQQSEKLKEMDQMKSRFFANISHEFRTPLTLIMGPLEQMLSDSGDDNHKKKLNLMLRNSQRLLGLINQLLELSKFESGKVTLLASEQNAVPLLKGIVTNFEPLTNQNELDLVFQSETQDITLWLDAEKIEDIFYNLLMNAVKFTPPGGRVTLSVKEIIGKDETVPGDSLQISVSDTGPGIPRDQVAHIFNRFYQSDSTFEHRKKGSGIGLALVKELVRVHCGKIDVYSREGKGTTFIVQLPMGSSHLEPNERAAPGAPAADKGLPVAGKDIPVLEAGTGAESGLEAGAGAESDAGAIEKEIILVVEDSADVREYIRGTLEPTYTVIEAEEGETGLKEALKTIPDLVISDIMMPVMDGYELCNRLKEDIKTSHIPVILLTAKASEDHVVQGL
ncbi:MAG: response regulator, partial [bacterium]|nr:response regulator [bacterium]